MAGIRKAFIGARLARAALLSSLFAAIAVSAILAGHAAGAHETRPAIADLTVGAERADLAIVLTLEAPLAGIDLEGLADTNEAPAASSTSTRAAKCRSA